MSFEFNPTDEDPHGECRHKIEQLRSERLAIAQELADVRRKLAADVRRILTSLVCGIESWGNDEDGIPDELWESYAEARMMLGQPADGRLGTKPAN